MNRSSRGLFLIAWMISMFIVLFFFMFPLLKSIDSAASSTVEDVEYEDSFTLTEGAESIKYERNTDEVSYFLGIGGTVTKDKFFITLDNGNTITPKLRKLSFEIEDGKKDWEIVIKGKQRVDKESEKSLSKYPISYTIISGKKEITELVADLTETFSMEFPVKQNKGK